MKTLLRVKLAALAAEIRSLRRHRKRWPAREIQAKDRSFERHPLEVTLSDMWENSRREARAANLAMAFLRGKDYLAVEKVCYFPPAWGRVETYVQQYGRFYVERGDNSLMAHRFPEWLTKAQVAASDTICKAARQVQAERGRRRNTERRVAYRKIYGLDESKETQAEMKARLKEKWEAERSKRIMPPGEVVD